MLDPGEEVLLPQPSYVSYLPCTIMADGVPVIVELKHENEFKLTVDDLKDKVVFKCDTAEEYLKAFNKIDRKPICKKNDELITLYDRLYSENAAYNIMKEIVEKTTGAKL